jgi:hypothetical protein
VEKQALTQREAIPELFVQWAKRADGTVLLRCVRRDGSTTWQHYEKHSGYFAFHDLRHFAVETTLGFRSGFYGLIADGWDIADTSGKGARGKPPASAGLVEHIVGLLQTEGAGGPALSAAEFNAMIDQMLGADPARPPLTDAQLDRVRNRTLELHGQWAAIPAGSTFELTFSRD